MKHLFKKAIIAGGVALAMSLGVVSTLAHRAEAKPVDASGEMRIYVDSNLGFGANISFWYDGAGSDQSVSGTIAADSIIFAGREKSSRPFYYLERAASYTGLYIKNSSGSNEWGPITAAANKLYQPTDWNDKTAYGTYSVIKVHITDDATVYDEYYVNEWNGYEAPDAGGKAGYEFTGWYLDSGFTQPFTGKSQGEATGDFNLFAKYETGVVYNDVTYYLSDPRGFLGSHAYAYLWKSSTEDKNADWPGVAMTSLGNHIFQIDSIDKYDRLIFNNGFAADPSYGEYNIQSYTIEDCIANDGNYYLVEYFFNSGKQTVVGEWAAAPEGDYLVHYNGDDYPMGVNVGLEDEYHVEFVTGATLSFTGGDEISFYRDSDLISNDSISINGSANAYKEDGHIYVHNSVSQKAYFKSVSGVSTFELYIGGYAESYSVSGQSLSIDGEFVPDPTYSAQYKSGSVSWTAGQSLILRESGHELTLLAEDGDNNAYDDSGVIKVHNAYTGILYVKVRISDGAFVAYLGGRTHTRAIEIGGTQYPLSLYQEPEKPDQYRALNVDVTAGETVKFIYDGVETSFTPKAVGNNNMTSGKKILASNESVDIYVSLSNEVWISGFGDVGGFHVLAGNRFVRMTLNPENPAEYYSDMVNFYDGEAVKIINCTDGSSLPTVFNPADGIDPASESEIKACFEVNDGVVTCTEDCSARVYIKISADHDQFYFASASPEVLAAVDYVNNFSSELKDACKEATESAKITAISTAWTKYKGIYTDDLSVAVQGVILEGSGSSVNEIKDFEERYCFFMSEYGTSASLDNFLGFSYSSASHVPSILASDASSIIMIVTIVSLVGVTAIGGFFYIRKRKSEK